MKIAQLQDWIEEHHAEGLSLEGAMTMVNLSDSSLKRRLKKTTGLSFTQYIQSVRIEKAKRLLLSTTLSVGAVSNSVGYENQSFFIRTFKKLTGATPSQYRIEGKDSSIV
ncbi:MAG: AraC family transcriptional regulator [Cellvibrionaceae bacterium]|nr:AraC family transcriptional regulator [Motiliproteus sp.]